MEPEETYPTLSPEQLQAKLELNEPLIVIDTLLGDHFEQARLPGARNACVLQVDFLDQIAALTADRAMPLVLYGADEHSQDAVTAADKLLRAGYRDVHILVGGLAAWHGRGLPLEGATGKLPRPLGPLPAVPDGIYPVDPEASIIEWAGPTTRFRENSTCDGRPGSR